MAKQLQADPTADPTAETQIITGKRAEISGCCVVIPVRDILLKTHDAG